MKKGFSLIELVLTIVIIAISVMSIPMLINRSSESDTFTLTQESILAAQSKVGNILSYMWDENSYDLVDKILRVLSVNGDLELNRVTNTPPINDNNLRIGHIYQDKRRRFYDQASDKTPMPSTAGLNSINKFDSQTINNIGSSAGQYDYKDINITMNTMVSYITDQADYSDQTLTFTLDPDTSKSITSNANSTNIKMIQLNTTTTLTDQTFVLRVFLTNIGRPILHSRIYN
jgi:prepilin-type N-terminal cleavage/methylation domain-containing protein